MSYILDALRKAERERGIAQVPTLMTVHETRRTTARNRLWLIAGISLVCIASIIWSAASFLRTAGAPIPSGNAVAARVPPEAGSSSVQATPVPSSVVATPAEARSPSTPQAISSDTPRADVPQADLPGEKRMGDEGHITIPRGTPPQSNVPEPAQNAVQQTGLGTVGTPAFPAKNASPAVTEGTENSQSKAISLREAMAKMKITILLYDEAKSERMVFINGRKYVEGDYVDGRYLLESITVDGVILSYQGERATLRASK